MHVMLLSLNAMTSVADMGTFLLTAMQARGHRVSTLGCRGVMGRCIYNWRYEEPARKQAACSECARIHSLRTVNWSRGQQSTQWLEDWLQDDETAELERQLAGKSVAEIVATEWQGWPLGRWVTPALRIEWAGQNWESLPDGADKARAWFVAAVRVALAIQHVIAADKPDVLLICDGTTPTERLAAAVARQRGVRSIFYLMGQDPEGISLSDDKPAGMYDFASEWPAWRDVPLTAAENEQLDAYLDARRGRGGHVSSSYSPPAQGHLDDLAAELGLQRGVRPLVSALAPVAADYVANMDDPDLFDTPPAFTTMATWLQAVVAGARRHPQADWVIRAHPAEPQFRSPDTVDSVLAGLAPLPENVTFLPPESPVSTYDLLELTQLAVTYHSTTGMEAAAMGLPVITGGQALYRNVGFVWHTTSAGQFAATLDRLVPDPQAPPQATELARRFLYFWFMRADRRAAMLRIQDGAYFGGYKTVSWLGPRRDPVLDDLCAYIAGEGPFIRPPQ